MGTNLSHISINYKNESKSKINKSKFIVGKNHFEFLYVIGRGGFGKVWKVKLKKTNEFFALKEMSKLKIVDRRSEESIKSERNLLATLNHPFIVNMYFAFQDFYNLYLVMDLLTGGDLRYHIAYRKTFTEQETKFFMTNMILALEYIHSKNIIHRDIKPENLVLESTGYLRITDFGVAKINEKDNSSETSGTPGYMAPEVILILNHSFVSDFFALGVIGYEFMLGYRPYLGGSRNEIKQLIMKKQAKIHNDKIPNGWSKNAVDFINKLLIRKANKRLGSEGIDELKTHPWMKDINWENISQKKITPPFIPSHHRENFDKKYCEGEDVIGEETIERYQMYSKSNLFADVFKNYTYCNLSHISNYHMNKMKKYQNNKSIKDIVEQKIIEEIKSTNEFKELNNIKTKNRSRSVEEINKTKKHDKNKNNLKKKDNRNQEYKTCIINNYNISSSTNNLSKSKKSNEPVKNINENIVYNNYINLHFNNFSSNNNPNNMNSLRKSISSSKKPININVCSNITKKTKAKISSKKKISTNSIKKNTIVKSSSMKMFQNDKKIFNYMLSFNKLLRCTSNERKSIKKKINYDNKNKSDLMSKNDELKSPIIKKYKLKKKKDLLMDIMNINNFKNHKILKTNVRNAKFNNLKIKTYANQAGKCRSSIASFNTERVISPKKKNKTKSKTNRTHLSMQNISNNLDYYSNIIENYNTINAQTNYNRTRTKNNIKIITKNKNLKTFISNNNTCKNNRKNINLNKISDFNFKTKNSDKNNIKTLYNYLKNKDVNQILKKFNSIRFKK